MAWDQSWARPGLCTQPSDQTAFPSLTSPAACWGKGLAGGGQPSPIPQAPEPPACSPSSIFLSISHPLPSGPGWMEEEPTHFVNHEKNRREKKPALASGHGF